MKKQQPAKIPANAQRCLHPGFFSVLTGQRHPGCKHRWAFGKLRLPEIWFVIEGFD